MSNTNNSQAQYYGIFYIHPITGKRCRISRTFTSEAGAARACEKRNTHWGNLNFFHADGPA